MSMHLSTITLDGSTGHHHGLRPAMALSTKKRCYVGKYSPFIIKPEQMGEKAVVQG
jgi:hypothetical protein